MLNEQFYQLVMPLLQRYMQRSPAIRGMNVYVCATFDYEQSDIQMSTSYRAL
jgi:hypothetical protein